MSNGNKYLDLRQASLHHSTIHSHWTTHTGTTCTHAHSTQLYLHLHTCTPSHLHNTGQHTQALHAHMHTPHNCIFTSTHAPPHTYITHTPTSTLPCTTHYTHCSHNTHSLHFHIPTHTHYTQYTPLHHTPTITQTVAANMSGELHLRMEAEVVTATTYFKDLQNHQFGKLICSSTKLYNYTPGCLKDSPKYYTS